MMRRGRDGIFAMFNVGEEVELELELLGLFSPDFHWVLNLDLCFLITKNGGEDSFVTVNVGPNAEILPTSAIRLVVDIR